MNAADDRMIWFWFWLEKWLKTEQTETDLPAGVSNSNIYCFNKIHPGPCLPSSLHRCVRTFHVIPIIASRGLVMMLECDDLTETK